jgi:hypothetical protein
VGTTPDDEEERRQCRAREGEATPPHPCPGA